MFLSSDTDNEQPTKEAPRTQLPWMPFLARPQMNFRLPKFSPSDIIRAPQKYMAGLLVLISLFLLAGGIYDLAESPLPLGFTDAGYQPIFTGLNNQFLIESLSAIIFIGLGAAGFYLMRFPADQHYGTNARSSTFILVLGALLLLIGVMATFMMLQVKLTGSI